MNRSRLSFLLLSLLVLIPVVTGTLMARDDDEGDDSLFKYLSVFQDVLRMVRQAYVEEVSVETLMDGALDGATDALDPFSTFIPADKVETYRGVMTLGLSRSGLQVAKDRGIVYVVSVAAGSPASLAEIQPGDVLTTIDGRPTRLLPLWRIHQSLAGDAGTVVPLEMLRRGAPLEVELELADFEPGAVTVSSRDGVAVMHLPTVDASSVVAVRERLAELAASDSEGLLLDLRDTVSESPEAAYALAELFTSGSLGTLRQGDAVIEVFDSDAEPVWQGDLVVLVGRGSLGGAEILATVLRESVGAQLVGQPSFGHAGRLTLVPLSSGAHLLLTDAFYAGPSGEPIRDAIEPDVEVSERTRRFADKDITIDDLTLRRGLELLTAPEVEELEDVA